MKTIRTLVFTLAAALLVVAAGVPSEAQYAPSAGSNLSRDAGRFMAVNYNYPSTNNYVVNGNSATGAASINVQVAKITLPDGRRIFPYNIFTPIIVGGPSNQELVTPTSVSNCYYNSSTGNGSCLITATFANVHGFGDPVVSGTGGLAEAIYDAFLSGGGLVVIDRNWEMGLNTGCTGCYASGGLAINSNTVFPYVAVEDDRGFAVQYWTPQPGLSTFTAPTTLTATTVGFGLNGANTTGGNYVGADTYYACIAYVDIYGQEGPCSASFNALTAGTGSTNQIGFAAPAASTGAIGYTIYISLLSGSYNLSYKVPLATYSNGVLTSTGVCTLTTFEKTTAACAVTNTTYGQTGSTAQVSALTLATSPIAPQSGVISTTSVYIPNAGGRTTYAYVPGSHVGTPGIPMAFPPFTAAPATGTTVPTVIGTINLPPNFMNWVGRTIEVCGEAVNASSQATIENIQFQWDAIGQNSGGKGVLVGNLTATKTGSTVVQLTFCEDFQTTVAGTSATAGSLQNDGGYLTSCIASLSACGAGGNTIQGATASLNLDNETRLNVIYLETTGDTDGETLQGLTFKVLN